MFRQSTKRVDSYSRHHSYCSTASTGSVWPDSCYETQLTFTHSQNMKIFIDSGQTPLSNQLYPGKMTKLTEEQTNANEGERTVNVNKRIPF